MSLRHPSDVGGRGASFIDRNVRPQELPNLPLHIGFVKP